MARPQDIALQKNSIASKSCKIIPKMQLLYTTEVQKQHDTQQPYDMETIQ